MDCRIFQGALERDVLSPHLSFVMAGEKITDPLIRTKLYRPMVESTHVHRPRLLERLDHGCSRPLTLVSAPAGYGKSVLVSCWLESCDIPNAWVSLDEDDSDLRTFTAYFAAAVETLFPDTCRNTQALLNAPSLPTAPVLGASLLNELARVEQSFIIVLDDFHIIKDTTVHDLLNTILRHPPQHMHLVIAGRWDPALNNTMLRAQGHMMEIRTQDLRFNQMETETFLTRALGKEIEKATAVILEEKTEGWVTGLRLAALSLRHQGHLDLSVLAAQADTDYTMEYLFNEVFSRQTPEIRKYLLGTAILNRFCAPLCEIIRTPSAEPSPSDLSGWDFISWLKKENMFLIPLDIENQWFRFHHLFQKLLFNQLKHHFSAKEVAALHRQASAWFTEEGLVEEAFKHALAAGDVNGAAGLVEQNRQAMLNVDRWYVLEKWLSLLPDTVIQQRPELLLAQVWVFYYKFKYTLYVPILEVIESLLGNKPEEQPLYGEINLFKGITHFFLGNGSLGLEYLEEALDRIPTSNYMIRGVAEIYFSLVGQMHGQKERVVHMLSDLLQNQLLQDLRKVHVMVGLVCVNIIAGDLSVASTLNQQLRNFAGKINSVAYIAWSSYFQGIIHLCRNELDMAIIHFSEAEEIFYVTLRRGKVDCQVALALAYQAGKETDQANAAQERLLTYIQSVSDPSLLDIAHSCRARLSLMKGETLLAPDVAAIHLTSTSGALIFWIEIPVITHCRVHIAESSDEGLQEAEKELQEYLKLSQAQHNIFQMIGIMTLQAVVYQKQGRTDEALAVLEKVVDLARPGGWIRPFIESGPTMESLLKRLAEKNVALDYIGQLLKAFRDEQYGMQFEVMSTQPLVNALTRRELEILDMLAQRLHNKEIAAKLFIAPETVKKHLKNIYAKLKVTGRQQAVEKARMLGNILRTGM